VGSVKTRYALVAAAALVLVLAGCTPSGDSVEHFAGLPDEEDVSQQSPDDDSGVQAFWMGDGEQLAVSVWGSSTCPAVGRSIDVVDSMADGNSVKVSLDAIADDKVCTRDFVPYTTVFWTPLIVTTTQPLQIEVGGQTVTLPIK
jgi:hypothetical protein